MLRIILMGVFLVIKSPLLGAASALEQSLERPISLNFQTIRLIDLAELLQDEMPELSIRLLDNYAASLEMEQVDISNQPTGVALAQIARRYQLAFMYNDYEIFLWQKGMPFPLATIDVSSDELWLQSDGAKKFLTAQDARFIAQQATIDKALLERLGQPYQFNQSVLLWPALNRYRKQRLQNNEFYLFSGYAVIVKPVSDITPSTQFEVLGIRQIPKLMPQRDSLSRSMIERFLSSDVASSDDATAQLRETFISNIVNGNDGVSDTPTQLECLVVGRFNYELCQASQRMMDHELMHFFRRHQSGSIQYIRTLSFNSDHAYSAGMMLSPKQHYLALTHVIHQTNAPSEKEVSVYQLEKFVNSNQLAIPELLIDDARLQSLRVLNDNGSGSYTLDVIGCAGECPVATSSNWCELSFSISP